MCMVVAKVAASQKASQKVKVANQAVSQVAIMAAHLISLFTVVAADVVLALVLAGAGKKANPIIQTTVLFFV